MPGLHISLVSTYELGHQPLGLASPAAALRAAGHQVACHDLSVDPDAAPWLDHAELVGISVPMHTAARLGVEVARRVRHGSPSAHIVFYGLYAAPLAGLLRSAGLTDSTIGGEYEPGMVALARSLASRPRAPGRGPAAEELRFDRDAIPVPDRRGLPPLARYAKLSIGDELRLAGYTEASRGCAHLCTHCPLTPVYGGRLRLVRQETVLADIENQVEMGARHITFGDPDFLNGVSHSLAICEAVQRRHPGTTFDFTAKVEHLVKHEALLPRLRDSGCLFITSAFESTNDHILGQLKKGHRRADMEHALALAEREGLVIRPTWVAFTPWTAAEDYLDLLAFIDEHGLAGRTQPVQYALRLLLPPGSPLVTVLAEEGRLQGFDSGSLTHTWASNDPRMDLLQTELASIVEAAAAARGQGGEAPEATFLKVRRAAHRLLTDSAAPGLRSRSREKAPGMTESWFC